MVYITRLQLTHFRNYEKARLRDLPAGFVILTGPNGAGKTNVLEAISLLSPGRGLRGAKVTEVQQDKSDHPWAVAACVATDTQEVRLGTGRDSSRDKRIVRINGETVSAKARLGDHMACVWLTPQMDGLFTGSASERRRFFDRLVFALDPGHAGRISRYDNAMRQRAKLLAEGHDDDAWLSGLEAQMAETGAAIAAARHDVLQRLQTVIDSTDQQTRAHFPRAAIHLSGFLETRINTMPALELEEAFHDQLAQARATDAERGGASEGTHRSDWHVIYAERDMPAEQCSTGEQKALLINIVLAHARLLAAERGAPPILLLDEVAAHLDENRRAALFEVLDAMQGQVWLTGTDPDLFKDAPASARHMFVQDNLIRQ
jgi:DNA replication and repair protein RecF